ncbi:hypothetical protein A28LD_1255 [Idiomarina sp. A28L]|uniref:hypothetical protein n=1 Tax=Idiomarina sp. A28L TaxID=1036674 RepID=UPI000213865F|nr:hypothetical protein [Idiomarina sp. A28L]EGN75239.1 hypothetical protein A28LD_1255 [Idiomarina sp. A28L]
MKLQQALSSLNQIEKSKFINCLDRLCSSAESCNEMVSQTLDKVNRQIKDATGTEITQLFTAVNNDFQKTISEQISMAGASMSLLVNILSRDGNGVARTSWIEKLYMQEWETLNNLAEDIQQQINNEQSEEFDHAHRLRIFKDCLDEAYLNDTRSNRDAVISDDERGILNILASHLKISTDEVAAIEHLANPIKAGKDTVDNCLQGLREIGVIFINRKNSEVIIVDEVVVILNQIQGKALSDKHLVRILRSLSDAELSNILKTYGKRIRGVSRIEKISICLHSGISVNNILSRDIFADSDSLNLRKERLKELISELGIQVDRVGTTIDERIEVILGSLRGASEREFNMLTATSFKEMFDVLSTLFCGRDANGKAENLQSRLRREFELEDVEDINPERLRALSITPFDVLYALSNDEIKDVRDKLNLSKRGNPRSLIIQNFESANDRLIEHYGALSRRDMKSLRDNGIEITEAEVGLKFEEATKTMLEGLELAVDEDLRKEINTAKDKVDIILAISEDDIIIGEAKTCKNGDFAKYSTTSRQVKAYANRCENFGKRVAQVLIVAPSFSDDFVRSAEMDPEINISLLTADGLKMIYDAFKAKRKAIFSSKLLSKGGLLKAELIAKSL